jgi:hypothetical protein
MARPKRGSHCRLKPSAVPVLARVYTDLDAETRWTVVQVDGANGREALILRADDGTRDPERLISVWRGQVIGESRCDACGEEGHSVSSATAQTCTARAGGRLPQGGQRAHEGALGEAAGGGGGDGGGADPAGARALGRGDLVIDDGLREAARIEVRDAVKIEMVEHLRKIITRRELLGPAGGITPEVKALLEDILREYLEGRS